MMTILACVVLLCVGHCAFGDMVDVGGYIGSHKRTFKAQSIARDAKLSVKEPADYIGITEVYPDTSEQIVYSYRVSGPGIGSYERTHRSRGFGPVTYFIRVASKPVGPIKISNHRTGLDKQSVFISSVWAVKNAELKSLLEWDRFTIMGLVPNGTPQQREDWVKMLAANLDSRPADHIGTGFASEIYFANRTKDNVREQLTACHGWARQFRLPALLGLVSWWSGTPAHEPDGLGGRFGDVKYQQVCYSPNVEVEENAELKALLGDRYDLHYGLSTPNQWSNCPWLTMNSQVLNAYRHKRLGEAVGLLKEVGKESTAWVKGIYVDNEPRYWDTQCEAGNPKSSRGELWADFNPLTVADAKKDGVDLDPVGGLSDQELAWLHRNVGVYNQGMIDALRAAISRHRYGANLPLYTHSLQLEDLFPGSKIGHPASEWAYADGARTGLEGLWSQPSDFYRVREWGPWSNLNREENDGQSIDLHLWDLRVSYMTGADLYNSYNWQAIGPERFFGYVKEFMDHYPVATMPPADARYVDHASLKFKTPMKLQAFSRIEIPVKVARKIAGSVFVSIAFDSGRCFSSQQQSIDLAPGARTLAIDFPTVAQIPWNREALVVLHVFDSKGGLALKCVTFTPESAKGIKLSLDLRTQRALSLAVISRAKR